MKTTHAGLTRRANLLKTLRHEKPEWIPLTGHVDPYNQPAAAGMDPELARTLRAVKWSDESTVAFSRYLDLDIMDWFGLPGVQARRANVQVETEKKDRRTITRWHTPKGKLRQVQCFSPETNMYYTEEHLLKSKEDLAVFMAAVENTTYAIAPNERDVYRRRRELIGEDGIMLITMQGTPLGQLIRIHAGVENTAYLWADARDELTALFRVMTEADLRRAELMATLEADAIVMVDDTSTTTISPAMFEACCLEYTDRIAAVAHRAGKFYFHHSCGLIRDLLDLYRQTQMDAVHAFQFPPIGNVTIAEGLRRLGPRIAIMPSLVQMCGSLNDRAAVADSIRAMYAEAGDGTNVIFGLAADPGKTMAETGFVRDECRKYQRCKSYAN